MESQEANGNLGETCATASTPQVIYHRESCLSVELTSAYYFQHVFTILLARCNIDYTVIVQDETLIAYIAMVPIA